MKCGSLDQIGILNSNASAKKGTSFLSEINSFALDKNLSEGSLIDTIFKTCFFTSSNNSIEIPDLEQISSEYLSSSLVNQSGLNNFMFFN